MINKAIVFLFCVLFCSLAFSGESKIVLEIGIEMDVQPATLCFTLQNHSESDFSAMPLGNANSKIIIVDPDKIKYELFVSEKIAKPIIIKPGESKVWKLKNFEFLKGNLSIMNAKDLKMDKKGKYIIYWQVNESKSNEIIMLKE